jgi:hypothetical protein
MMKISVFGFLGDLALLVVSNGLNLLFDFVELDVSVHAALEGVFLVASLQDTSGSEAIGSRGSISFDLLHFPAWHGNIVAHVLGSWVHDCNTLRLVIVSSHVGSRTQMRFVNSIIASVRPNLSCEVAPVNFGEHFCRGNVCLPSKHL